MTQIAFAKDVRGYVEWGAGGGLSFPIANRRVYFGAAYEQREVGTNAMFVFGAPVGELY